MSALGPPQRSAGQVLPPTKRVGALYSDSTDALKAVREDYLYWTGKVTDSSLQLSLAIIAANWAAFGSVQKILSNRWSKFSLGLIIITLGLNLFSAWCIGELHQHRIDYAQKDSDRWDKECAAALSRKGPWPFTSRIEYLGFSLRIVKTWFPLAAGALFLLALFKA